MTRRPVVVLVGALLLASACGGSDDDAGPSAQVTSPPTEATTTTTVPVEEQVRQAYLHSWDVYAEAMRTLDTSRLDEVYAPPHLETAEQEVEDLQAKGRAGAIDVDHDLRVTLIDDVTAVVYDRVTNRSVEVDPATGEALEPQPNEQTMDNYTLKLIEGTWKVTVVVRQR